MFLEILILAVKILSKSTIFDSTYRRLYLQERALWICRRLYLPLHKEWLPGKGNAIAYRFKMKIMCNSDEECRVFFGPCRRVWKTQRKGGGAAALF